MKIFRFSWLVLLLFLQTGPARTTAETQATQATQATVRGITVSTHRGGQEWASDAIVPTFREIKELGGNWVAIHPYAGIRGDGSVRRWRLDSEDTPEHIARPIREAHKLGLKILIKPHLGYWGSPFSWRGEISFKTDEEWNRFWSDYRAWIVELAAMSREADGFVVGTELDKTLHFEEEWREIIAEVRKVNSVPLTYASNWSDYQRVGFWDALDTIGVQAYFPISEAEKPDEADLRRGWLDGMKKLASYAEEQNRTILFTELGYNRSFAAAARPWEYKSDGPEAEEFQAACMRAALAAVEQEERVVGAFLWKWFPGPRPSGRNFQLATPGMRKVIREAWVR